VHIRTARPEEYDALGELTYRTYAADHPAIDRDIDGRTYGDELRDVAGRAAGADVLVAVDDDTILGGVTYVGDPASPLAEHTDPDAASIRMLVVAPDVQRRGIGEALSRACIERARAAGRRQVVLHSASFMRPAHALYAKLGFERDTGLDIVIPDIVELYGFRLRLS
jgi:ribosomal protein S18 acetylase RimI-like enzyme